MPKMAEFTGKWLLIGETLFQTRPNKESWIIDPLNLLHSWHWVLFHDTFDLCYPLAASPNNVSSNWGLPQQEKQRFVASQSEEWKPHNNAATTTTLLCSFYNFTTALQGKSNEIQCGVIYFFPLFGSSVAQCTVNIRTLQKEAFKAWALEAGGSEVLR